MLSLPKVRVQSLVEELRLCKPCIAVKKKGIEIMTFHL